MSARAIVTRYNNESILPDGSIAVEWHGIVADPATFPAQLPSVIVGVAVLDANSPGTWSSTVEADVIAVCAALPSPFTVTAATVFIPTIA